MSLVVRASLDLAARDQLGMSRATVRLYISDRRDPICFATLFQAGKTVGSATEAAESYVLSWPRP